MFKKLKQLWIDRLNFWSGRALTLNGLPITKSNNESLDQKLKRYHDATNPVDGNIAPVSHTWAKKNILGWTDEEILTDLKEQREQKQNKCKCGNCKCG